MTAINTSRTTTDGVVPTEPPLRFTLRGLLVMVAVAAIVFTVVHLLLNARESERRAQTKEDFRHIAAGLCSFDEVYNRLPYPVRHAGDPAHHDPDARPLYSWRFSIVRYVYPYAEGTWPLDKSWDSKEYQLWRELYQVYAYSQLLGPPHPQATKAFAITGPGTAFGDGKTGPPRSLDDIDSDTILVVEVRDSGLHWMAPGDFDIRNMPQRINAPSGHSISSRHGTGFHVVFADAEVWYLGNDVPFDKLKKFFTVDNAKLYNRDEILRPYLR